MWKSRIIITILLLFIPSLSYGKEIGKITALQGNVDILRGGKPPAVEAKVNMPINLSDVIRTKTDSKAEVILIDGTVLKIAPRSRVDISELIIDEKTIRALIGLPRGKVGAYVAKETTNKIVADPKANRFEIKTPIAVAGVRGSTPIVSHRNNITTVFALTGLIYTYNIKIPDVVVLLREGQYSIIRETQAPTAPAPYTPSEQRRELLDITISQLQQESPPLAQPPPPVDNSQILSNQLRHQLMVETFQRTLIERTEPQSPTQEIIRSSPPITETVSPAQIAPPKAESSTPQDLSPPTQPTAQPPSIPTPPITQTPQQPEPVPPSPPTTPPAIQPPKNIPPPINIPPYILFPGSGSSGSGHGYGY